ncbi:hypothetical protein [Pedobacter sp.]
MKKIYFILLVILMNVRVSHAQDTTSLVGKMQFIFAQLNCSAISTGFLEERAFPLVSLTPFNGTLTDSKIPIFRYCINAFPCLNLLN